MSFLENMGKTLGHVAVGLNDAAKTVADGAQIAARTMSDAAQTVTEAAAETMDQIKQQKASEGVRKCPACGQPLSGLVAVCPLCGYELSTREIATDSSVSDFANELRRIEEGRYSILASVSKKVSARDSAHTDERIASAIRNFVIPNSKQAIFEFMMLAAGNLNIGMIARLTTPNGTFVSGYEYDPVHAVQAAWFTKFGQAYQKAQMAFGTDADFSIIQELYGSKMNEIEAMREKPGKRSRRTW